MTEAARLAGEPVAAPIRARVAERAERLVEAGHPPTLATVLASDSPADRAFVELKHEAATDAGIESRDVRVDPSEPDALVSAVRDASDDPEVDGVFVQAPLPAGADEAAVRAAVAPEKDVDAFHPDSLGRLVVGAPRFVPATTAAVLRLLEHYGVPLAGRDVTVVGRSTAIGRPLANRLLRRGEPGDATVTVCHSRTRALAERTRGADVVITAAGRPGLVDGSMLSPGATVVDVSATRRDAGEDVEYVGDVEAASAAAVADALTPVPGGVGPVTVACLLENAVLAAERRAGLADGGTGP